MFEDIKNKDIFEKNINRLWEDVLKSNCKTFSPYFWNEYHCFGQKILRITILESKDCILLSRRNYQSSCIDFSE